MKYAVVVTGIVGLIAAVALLSVLALNSAADESVTEVDDADYCAGMTEIIDQANPQSPGTMEYRVDEDCKNQPAEVE